jgi:hypothetical protein
MIVSLKKVYDPGIPERKYVKEGPLQAGLRIITGLHDADLRFCLLPPNF